MKEAAKAASFFLTINNSKYEKEYYDLFAFNLEQALQLLLKFTLLQKLGDYPKIHNLFEIFEALKEAIPEKEIQLMVEKYRETINAFQLAYLESRYFQVRFFQEKNILKIIRTYVKEIGRHSRRKLGDVKIFIFGSILS